MIKKTSSIGIRHSIGGNRTFDQSKIPMQQIVGCKVKMAALVDWYRRVTKRRFIRFGVPFLVCIVGGSFALKQFASVRYDFRKGKRITPKEAEQFGVKVKNKDGIGTYSIEKAYEDYQREDLDSWENIRGPRPWEDSKAVQDVQRQKKTEPS